MAKTDIKGIKGRPQWFHAIYDFAVDGGALNGTVDLFVIKAGGIIHDSFFEVETDIESLGAATIDVGITGGDVDGIFSQFAKATLVADYVSDQQAKGDLLYDDSNDHDIRLKYTAEEEITMLIGTAALTAGKIHYYLLVSDGY